MKGRSRFEDTGVGEAVI